jgi:2-oxoisovalerate dehydrogenase E2 component (dihydrolipoyl transacylase)
MIGTGRNNRITRKDVQKIIDSTPHQVKKNTNTSLGTLASDQYKLEVTPIRKITASNMAKSANLIPQAWTLTEVDVSGMVNLRQSLKENFLKQEGINITYLPFVIKAVAQSLKTNLLLNSSWGKDHIVMKKRINIGIAAATENGLVVPVIHDADTLSVSGLAHKIDDLTKKSRDGMLTIDAVSGGTFTVNNTGVLGSIASQPLVNYPQAAIMTTEAIIRRPVVIGDGIAIRSMMNLCLSFDHRIMDGKEAGGFNHDVKQTLESINENTPIY